MERLNANRDIVTKKTLSFTVKAIHASMDTIEYQKQPISLSFHLSCHSVSSLALRDFECKARSRSIPHLPWHCSTSARLFPWIPTCDGIHTRDISYPSSPDISKTSWFDTACYSLDRIFRLISGPQ
jgi:hypothetical protein